MARQSSSSRRGRLPYFAAKRLYKTAQCFSLGSRVTRDFALPVRRSSGKVGRRRKSGGRGTSLGSSACYFTVRPNIASHFSSFVPFSQNYGGQSGHLS